MNQIASMGAALVRRRRALGLTQSELASRLGLKRQQVQRWEANEYRTASLERVAAVAEALAFDAEPESMFLPAEAPAVCATRPESSTEPSDAGPVRDLGEAVVRIRANANELHDRFGVTRIAVFGSFARGEQTPDSDVDLIIEVDRPTRKNVFGAEHELRRILGRKVDAGPLEAVRSTIRQRVARGIVDVWRA